VRTLPTVLAALLILLVAAGPATAAPGRGPTAVVTLGDSFISGEGGRWQGNSLDETGSRSGTDRAWTGLGYDTSRVYLEGTDVNGCHRSDVAEVRSARLPVQERINLACSGAVAANVWRASSGGQPRYGEAPQADRLTAVARAKDVRAVVLSIGGNDLGFASIISACVTAYVTTNAAPDPCSDDQQAVVDARLPAVRANVAKAIDEVRAAMRAAGYGAGQWRLVLQGYPSPVGRAAENRLPEAALARVSGGCPFFDRDLDWARDRVVAQLGDALRAVARSKGVQFLDLREALAGKEVCARGTQLATPLAGPAPERSEWVRFLPPTVGQAQGELQESLHPNAYGQAAFGRCLELLAAVTGPAYTCRRSGATPAAMTLEPAARR
jgi:lysophospholipase L1-like esterase